MATLAATSALSAAQSNVSARASTAGGSTTAVRAYPATQLGSTSSLRTLSVSRLAGKRALVNKSIRCASVPYATQFTVPQPLPQELPQAALPPQFTEEFSAPSPVSQGLPAPGPVSHGLPQAAFPPQFTQEVSASSPVSQGLPAPGPVSQGLPSANGTGTYSWTTASSEQGAANLHHHGINIHLCADGRVIATSAVASQTGRPVVRIRLPTSGAFLHVEAQTAEEVCQYFATLGLGSGALQSTNVIGLLHPGTPLTHGAEYVYISSSSFSSGYGSSSQMTTGGWNGQWGAGGMATGTRTTTGGSTGFGSFGGQTYQGQSSQGQGSQGQFEWTGSHKSINQSQGSQSGQGAQGSVVTDGTVGGAAFIIVQTVNGSETIRVHAQQTVAQALNYLRQLGVGEGVLLTSDGGQLMLETVLSSGRHYIFRTQSGQTYQGQSSQGQGSQGQFEWTSRHKAINQSQGSQSGQGAQGSIITNGAVSGAAFIIVQGVNWSETIPVQQQTAAQALHYLRELGCGEGVLVTVDGQQLRLETVLSSGGHYYFRTQSGQTYQGQSSQGQASQGQGSQGQFEWTSSRKSINQSQGSQSGQGAQGSVILDGAVSGAAFIIVQSGNKSETIRVHAQQSAAQALHYLRELGYGAGMLVTVDGQQLTSETVLSSGGHYYFRTQSGQTYQGQSSQGQGSQGQFEWTSSRKTINQSQGSQSGQGAQGSIITNGAVSGEAFITVQSVNGSETTIRVHAQQTIAQALNYLRQLGFGEGVFLASDEGQLTLDTFLSSGRHYIFRTQSANLGSGVTTGSTSGTVTSRQQGFAFGHQGFAFGQQTGSITYPAPDPFQIIKMPSRSINVNTVQTVGQVLQILATRSDYGPGVLHAGNGVVLQQNERVEPGRDYFFISQSHFSGFNSSWFTGSGSTGTADGSNGVGSQTGLPATFPEIRITSPLAGVSMIVRARTAAEALATLRPFMNAGTLQFADGTPVEATAFLSPGLVYNFVPSGIVPGGAQMMPSGIVGGGQKTPGGIVGGGQQTPGGIMGGGQQTDVGIGSGGPTVGTGQSASGQAVRITDPSGKVLATIEPQTAQQAWEYMRRKVGDGLLENPNGVGLAPSSLLTTGVDYIFRSAMEQTVQPSGSVIPPLGIKKPQPVTEPTVEPTVPEPTVTKPVENANGPALDASGNLPADTESILENWDFEDEIDSITQKGQKAPNGEVVIDVLPHWKITKTKQVDLVGGDVFAAAHGDYSLHLNNPTTGASAIEQAFKTEPGSTYTVTFSLAAHPHIVPNERIVNDCVVYVSVGDFKWPFVSTKLPKKNNGKPSPVDWKDYTFVFKAVEPVSIIKFESPTAMKDTKFAACIDNVRIVQGGVPIPPVDLIQNGNFEWSGLTDLPGARTVLAGKDNIPHWKVSTGRVNLKLMFADLNAGSPQSGLYWIELIGAPAGIEQTFETKAGQEYTVKFGFASRPIIRSTMKMQEVIVSAGDFKKTFTSPPATTSFTGWKTETFTFTAKDKSTTLKFECPDGKTVDDGAYLDNVSVVEATPTPATAAANTTTTFSF